LLQVYRLQVFGLKSCPLGNPGEHARTGLFSIVEGKDEVSPCGPRVDTRGATLPFDTLAHAQERCEHPSRSRAGAGTHAAAKAMLNRSGVASAWSRPSATMQRTSAWTFVSASSECVHTAARQEVPDLRRSTGRRLPARFQS
jgi:hypothetical protein